MKYWNILARGLRERFPGRPLYVGAYTYSGYEQPPVAEILEPNVAIGHVAHFPSTREDYREQQKRDWLKWSSMSSLAWYRPNFGL